MNSTRTILVDGQFIVVYQIMVTLVALPILVFFEIALSKKQQILGADLRDVLLELCK